MLKFLCKILFIFTLFLKIYGASSSPQVDKSFKCSKPEINWPILMPERFFFGGGEVSFEEILMKNTCVKVYQIATVPCSNTSE